mmetsp:Transcript_22461/g.66595  ORF Transcript_22461/g.66595 Transcript_22461/m.66595 type:complete len:209 (-) Transcript_22461:944-1570(-)
MPGRPQGPIRGGVGADQRRLHGANEGSGGVRGSASPGRPAEERRRRCKGAVRLVSGKYRGRLHGIERRRARSWCHGVALTQHRQSWHQVASWQCRLDRIQSLPWEAAPCSALHRSMHPVPRQPPWSRQCHRRPRRMLGVVLSERRPRGTHPGRAQCRHRPAAGRSAGRGQAEPRHARPPNIGERRLGFRHPNSGGAERRRAGEGGRAP